MIRFILTRHGETIENQQNILQGQLPGQLSSLGIKQAEELSELLKDEEIDVIVSSDLSRSCETARVVGLPHKLTPVQTSLLREMDWGPYTGKRLDNVNWENLPVGTESLTDLYKRASRFLDFLKNNYDNKVVLAVGHGAFNRAIIACLENREANEMIEMPIMENTQLLKFDII